MPHIREILGYKKVVEKLNSICDFLKEPGKYTDFGINLPNGVLIFGKMGVGKTFIAKALVTDCEREVFYVSGGEIDARKIKAIFKKARKSAYSVVLIDDIDCLNKEDDSDIYDRLIQEICCCKNGEVFVVITADEKENVPDYFMSGFEPDMIIQLAPPKIEEACEIFKPIFDERKMSDDFNIGDFCCFANGNTYSYALATFHQAARSAIYEGCGLVSMRHLIKAGLSLKGDELADEFDIATAYHEAGHAAVNLLLGGDAACIVLLDHGGGVFSEKEGKTENYRDKERRYIVRVAGKACEEIFTGTSAIGSYSDLGRVSAEIEADVKMLASQGFEYFDSTELNSPAYNDALAKKVQSDLQKYYDRAKELVVQNKPLIEMLVERLKENFYLLHSEIYALYNSYITSKK